MNQNLEAVAENARNKKHIHLTHGGGITTLAIDSKKATYRGTKAKDLSEEQKKKFENIVLFMFLSSLQQIPKIVYN